MNTERLVTWLVEGALDAPRSEDVLARVCEELASLGVPLTRAEAFVRTLHPHVVGRSFVWRPGRPVETLERTYEFLQSTAFKAAPIGQVFHTGEYVRARLEGNAQAAACPIMGELVREDMTDVYMAPFRFRSGEVHAVTFATQRTGGFREEDLAAIRSVIPALSRIAEILALSRTAVNLLSTYVGQDAGERILSGQIRRGNVDSIRAVIWFSDLRGFTSMSGELPPGEMIRALNELFECQVAAIERRGGEVLKFIGDGLLAIFRIADGHRTTTAQCETALTAAEEVFANLETINARRTKKDERPLRVGLALHVGEVAYGNIGGVHRLDFTCIGPAVNLAARLEGLASRLGRSLVVSQPFRESTTRPLEALGEFELKGISEKQAVYAPA